MTDEELIAFLREIAETAPDGDDVLCNACADRLEALAASRAPAWRPISEAPRDGKPVLVWAKGWARVAVAAHLGSYWCMDLPEIGMRVVRTAPTHFMPLPAPPQESRDDN